MCGSSFLIFPILRKFAVARSSVPQRRHPNPQLTPPATTFGAPAGNGCGDRERNPAAGNPRAYRGEDVSGPIADPRGSGTNNLRLRSPGALRAVSTQEHVYIPSVIDCPDSPSSPSIRRPLPPPALRQPFRRRPSDDTSPCPLPQHEVEYSRVNIPSQAKNSLQ